MNNEAEYLATRIGSQLPSVVDGKSAILEMKDNGSKKWKHLEWFGWWFEFFCEKLLDESSGFTRGPVFGKVEFDAQRKFVWDLKAHSKQSGAVVPLNDQEAVRWCVSNFGGLGYVILEGDASYESDSGEFRLWHDLLKGKKSSYQKRNAAANKPHRKRKSQFIPTRLVIVWIDSLETIQDGLDQGWLSAFQEGMINSNGKNRRAKFKMNLDKVPSKLILQDIDLAERY